MPSETAPPRSSDAIEAIEAIEAIDLPLASLTPVRQRTARKNVFNRLEANIRTVGLIEPLLVYRQGSDYFILDGYLRFQVLQDMGVVSVPCLVIESLDLYTPNRQVNYLSRSQYSRMIKQALTVVDEDRLKSSLAISKLQNEFSAAQQELLCPEALERVRTEQMAKSAAIQLMHVTQGRQREILQVADKAKDHSAAFVRTQIMKTAPEQRVQRPGRASPWNRAAETKKRLVDKLTDAEQHHDFYQGLYREYATDLVRLAIHVRQMVNTKEIANFMGQRCGEDLKLFRQIVQQYGEQASAG